MKTIHVVMGLVVSLLLAVVAVYLASADTPSTALLERLYYLTQISLPIIAVIGGTLALLELQNSRRMREYAQFEATATRIVTISRLLLENQASHRELQVGTVKSEAGQLLAEGILDLIDTELLRSKEFMGRKGLPQLSDYFADLFTELPGLRSALDRRHRWYSDELRLLADRDAE
ncbi:hypothetical protein H5398_08435 [Tessaracoccus sp. MC1679]|uniref:hypothetical protein n=1 Tax=Tessaracoccus sp. MC1679 TaxID=2760313 RepID=UPI001602002C|nr:hypothetical protein [Tessaracoccus sp. MC1679]MBB1515992.1 hypothetical protein [Tessaracoccus sp. MC1679]